MFFSQGEKPVAEPYVIALVELDMQNRRVLFLFGREAIRERMQEMEHSRDHAAKHTGSA